MKIKTIFLLVLTTVLLSFISAGKNEIEFSYPKNKQATFTMTTDLFKKFTKEWRGEDYYYFCGSDFVCSVLFYKLNEAEVKDLHELEKESGVPKGNGVYPLQHFSANSRTKEYESNEKTWGEPDGEFMFRQVDIKEIAGQKINQKNMFAYAMFGEDLYVDVHMSKVLCTPEDSTVMREIMETLKKKK